MGKSGRPAQTAPAPILFAGRPSALLDTRVVSCGGNLEQLAKLPDAGVDLIYIEPAFLGAVEGPFNSIRNYQVFWGETKEKRAFGDRHASRDITFARLPTNHSRGRQQ